MLERFVRGIIEREGRHSVVEVPLDQISVNPFQPRRTFDRQRLEELAKSIKELGVLQPIIVRRAGVGYELVAGERRVRASRIAGNKTIPAIVRNLDEQDMIEIAFIENLQREQLNELEEAEAFGRLVSENAGNVAAVADRLGKDVESVQSRLWLLALPQVVKKAVVARLISLEHAKIIAKIRNEKRQVEALEKIYKEKLSVEDSKKLLDSIPDIYKEEQREAKEAADTDRFSLASLAQLDVGLSLLRDFALTLRLAGVKLDISEYFDTSALNVRLTFPIEKIAPRSEE